MKGFKIALRLAFTMAFLVTAISLIGQNQEPLSVEIFTYVTPTYPKWIIVLGSILIGVVISALFFVFELVVMETRNVRLRRHNQKLERALAAAQPSNVNGGHGAVSSTVRVTSEPSLIDDSDV